MNTTMKSFVLNLLSFLLLLALFGVGCAGLLLDNRGVDAAIIRLRDGAL